MVGGVGKRSGSQHSRCLPKVKKINIVYSFTAALAKSVVTRSS